MKGMKTGGRKKGTPNKDNPLKQFLKSHSVDYFMPREQPSLSKAESAVILSQFEMDMNQLSPEDRVNAELRLLEFHTPKMKSLDMDMKAHVEVRTIEDRLRTLCGDDSDIISEADDSEKRKSSAV